MDQQFYLFFDTETTGLPKNYNAPSTDLRNWPRLVQISWIVSDNKGTVISKNNHFIKPRGFEIPENVARLHGITTERALETGERVEDVLHLFWKDVQNANYIIGHNVSFDKKIVEAEFYRMGEKHVFLSKHTICTQKASTDYCKIPSPGNIHKFKWPTLSELYYILFAKDMDGAHNSEADVQATFECFWELMKMGLISGLGVDGGIITIADEYTSDDRIRFTTFEFNANDYDGYGGSASNGRFWERLVEHDWNLFAEKHESQVLVFHNNLQAHLVKKGIGFPGRFFLKEYNSIILSFGDESYYLHCEFYNSDIIILKFDQSYHHILLSRKDLVFNSVEEIRGYLINLKQEIDQIREENRKRNEIEQQNRIKRLIEDICRTDVEVDDRRVELLKSKFKHLSSIVSEEEAAQYQKYVDNAIRENEIRREREAEEREKRIEKKLLSIAVCTVFILFICIWFFGLFFHLSNRWNVCDEILGWSMLLCIFSFIICLPYGLFVSLLKHFNKVKAITLTVLFVLFSCITIFSSYIYHDDWSSFKAYDSEIYLSLTKYNIFEDEAKSHIEQRISLSNDLEELNKFLHNNTSGYYEKEAKERLYAIADQLYNQAETLGDWLYLINNAPQEYKTEAEKNYAHLDSIVWDDENLAYKNAKSLRSMEAYNKYLSRNFNNERHRNEIENYVSKQNEFNDMMREIEKIKQRTKESKHH